MDLPQFEQIYDDLSRLEKKQFAEYINDQVVNLHEISNLYEEKFPLSKSELLEQLKNREDALETIVCHDVEEAMDWLERESMN
jgi:hypothetical protein